MTGASVSDLAISSISDSFFIATLNIISNNLRGTWQLSLPLGYYYDVVVYAISDLTFSSDLLTPDPSSDYGISPVEGKLLSGI